MAQIDWHQKGHDYAYNWAPGSKLPEFPDDTAKQHFTDGYKTGWWERGSDDARSGRKMEKFPNRIAASNYVDGYEDEAGDWDD